MKRTKQAAAVLTALALAASMALPVFAVTHTGADGDNTLISGDSFTDTTEPFTKSATCTVNATYNPDTVYHLDIEWNNMSFTYTPGKWTAENGDNDQLAYVKGENETIGWNNKESRDTPIHTIKVTNKSNANIKVQFRFESDSETTVSGLFYDSDKKIEENGIWMQRADANVDGLDSTAGGTSGGNIEAEKTGKVSEATVALYLIGRPQKKYNSSKIGTVTITLTAAGENDPIEANYSKIYKQSTP